jgi:tetrahydromethanopterin S-methyltransferase subunit B
MARATRYAIWRETPDPDVKSFIEAWPSRVPQQTQKRETMAGFNGSILYCVSALMALLLLASSSTTSVMALEQPRSRALNVDLVGTLDDNIVALQETIALFNLTDSVGATTTAAATECPVCDNGDTKLTGRVVQRILSRAGGVIRRTSSLASLKRAMRTRLGRRRYNKIVSQTSLVPTLNAAGSNFTALARSAQTLQTAAKTNNATIVELQLLDVLEVVANLSAKVTIDIAAVMQRAENSTTAGLAAMSLLSVLEFFERVSLATSSVLVDQVAILQGQNPMDTIHVKVATLQATLSNKASTTGVFTDISKFLSARRDTSGLVPALSQVKQDMASLDQALERFLSSADAATTITSSKSTGTNMDAVAGGMTSPIRGPVMAAMSGLMAGLMATVLDAVQIIALDSVSGNGNMSRVLISTAGLTLKRVDGILNQSMVTFNAIFGLFQTATKETVASGDTVFLFAFFAYQLICWIPGVDCILFPVCSSDARFTGPPCLLRVVIGLALQVILIPIFLVYLIIASLFDGNSDGTRAIGTNLASVESQVRCQQEALSCQTRTLLAALPNI